MKKLVLFTMFLIGFLFIPVAVTLAASFIGEQVFDKEGIEQYFYSLGALAGLVLPVTQFVKNIFKSSGNWTRFISWVVAVGLSFFGWWLDLGILSGLSVVWVIIYGVAAGLIANSVFEAFYVEMILKLFKDKTPPK